MSELTKWILRFLTKRIVKQGNHRYRIKQYYSILIEAAREEFTEDSRESLNTFLADCHDEALHNVWGYDGLQNI